MDVNHHVRNLVKAFMSVAGAAASRNRFVYLFANGMPGSGKRPESASALSHWVEGGIAVICLFLRQCKHREGRCICSDDSAGLGRRMSRFLPGFSPTRMTSMARFAGVGCHCWPSGHRPYRLAIIGRSQSLSALDGRVLKAVSASSATRRNGLPEKTARLRNSVTAWTNVKFVSCSA